MSGTFPEPEYMPCAECGASVPRSERDDHVCEEERLLEYRMFQLGPEVDAFEEGLATYLATAHGRFASWYAERTRNRH